MTTTPPPEPTPTPTPAVYTVHELANLLRLSKANTYARLKAGEIPARQIGTRWIIARHRIHLWLLGKDAA
jgi:excisionase family DNA binding protein